jgi:glycosyltransferase involved in cell wall biosynthesis
MKIAFVTTYNASDVNSWSGTPYFMSKALLDAGVELEFIGDLKNPRGITFFSKLKEYLFNRILKGKLGEFVRDYEPYYLKYLASQVEEKLKTSDADLVFSPGAIPISYLNTNKPVVMWSDATFAVMHNYSGFSNLCFSTVRSCHRYERNVFKRLSLAVFSSDWAAKSAIRDYNANEECVKVIPYGANFICNRTSQDIADTNKAKSREICKLLFVGKDWIRKGGDTAVKIAIALNALNIKTELTLVGCNLSDSYSLPDFVTNVGFIDKSKKEGSDLIDRLYNESHFFVLPTIADCTPIVFSEANSYGLPVITTNTGGIPSIIRDDVNGKMFDVNYDVESCAVYIKQVFSDYDKYSGFSMSSYEEYKTVLNWENSISKLITYMKETIIRKDK